MSLAISILQKYRNKHKKFSKQIAAIWQFCHLVCVTQFEARNQFLYPMKFCWLSITSEMLKIPKLNQTKLTPTAVESYSSGTRNFSLFINLGAESSTKNSSKITPICSLLFFFFLFSSNNLFTWKISGFGWRTFFHSISIIVLLKPYLFGCTMIYI